MWGINSMQSKRGVDEFSPKFSNKRHQSFENGAKMTYQQERKDHRTLLLRNLTSTITESDIRSIVLSFTEDSNLKILMVPHQGNAFVEFPTPSEALSVLSEMKQRPLHVKGAQVDVVLSRRPTITARSGNNLNSSRPASVADSPTERSAQSNILLVSITNLVYPVDIELIHFLFSKHGRVTKIVCFSKNPSTFQAFVQFENREQSSQALSALNNRNIYSGSNLIHLSYSNMDDLIVKTNNSKSWDYTNPALLETPPAYDTRSNRGRPVGARQRSNQSQYNSYPLHQPLLNTPLLPNPSNHSLREVPAELRDTMVDLSNPRQTPVVICYNLPDDVTPTMVFNLFSIYGYISRVKILRDKPDSALIQYTHYLYASLANVFLQRQQLLDKRLQISFSKNMEVKVSNAPTQSDSNNNEDSKRTMQFNIRDQRYGTDEIQRYIRGACRPTKLAFIANIPLETTEEELIQHIANGGDGGNPLPRVTFKARRDSFKTQLAVVELDSVDDAILFVMKFHNTLINDKPIKVAFSKSTTGES